MKFLKKTHLDDKLYTYSEKPGAFIYGICLGMQLLFTESEEYGLFKGLKLIKESFMLLWVEMVQVKVHFQI